MPGTINLLLYGRSVILPNPHAAVIGGSDFMRAYLADLFWAQAITAHFAEPWDLLHAAGGEVHGGTNALRRIPARGAWWEVAR